MKVSKYISLFLQLLFFCGCNTSEEKRSSSEEVPISPDNFRHLSNQFKEYWFSGKAEITSYQLTQERYGEMREGTSVVIFVTEDFSADTQVKTNLSLDNRVAVLKMNRMTNFNTGIYPYSLMTSAFNPIATMDHSLKLSTSAQEWCGQVYIQLNNRTNFEITSHSYFEGEADQTITLQKTWLEDELWNRIRLNPEELPTGNILMIPSFEYIRLWHKEKKAYKAIGEIKQLDSLNVYMLYYPELQRKFKLFYQPQFPFEIAKYEEINGNGPNDTLKTTGKKLKRMKTDYWNQNRNEFAPLRDSLGLK